MNYLKHKGNMKGLNNCVLLLRFENCYVLQINKPVICMLARVRF